MDPVSMDYMMHGQPQRMPSHTDPNNHASPNAWSSSTHGQPHVSPPAIWPPPSSPPVHHHHHHHHHHIQYYGTQRAQHLVPHAFPLGQNGGLPSLDPNLRNFSSPDPIGLPLPIRPWPHQFYHMAGPPPAVQLNPLSMNGSAGEIPYTNAAPGPGRHLLYPTPPSDMGLTLPGASTEPLPLPRPLFPQPVEHSAPNMNSLPQQTGSQFPNPVPPHHFNSNPAHRVGQPASSTIPRAPRSSLPQASLFIPSPHHPEFWAQPSSPSDRRRPGHTRARRSVNPRLATVESAREGDDDVPHSFRNHAVRPSHRASSSLTYSLDDATVRQMQVLRGAVSRDTKMVASRGALQSLLSVNIEDLPENERTCVICYNDYGVKTPEGINEAPLRLPKCKHVFGDHCIKKWFEDSDSCPYCRDKLPSESKYQCQPARALMNMMRLRGGLPQGLPDEMYLRLVTSMTSDGELEEHVPRHYLAAERRSLPDDAGEGQRRMRPRHDSSEDSHSDDEVVNDVAHLTSETSAAPVYIPSFERHSQWMSRAGDQRRAAHMALNQTRGTDAAERQAADDVSPRAVVEGAVTHSTPASSRQQTMPSLTDPNHNRIRPW